MDKREKTAARFRAAKTNGRSPLVGVFERCSGPGANPASPFRTRYELTPNRGFVRHLTERFTVAAYDPLNGLAAPGFRCIELVPRRVTDASGFLLRLRGIEHLSGLLLFVAPKGAAVDANPIKVRAQLFAGNGAFRDCLNGLAAFGRDHPLVQHPVSDRARIWSTKQARQF